MKIEFIVEEDNITIKEYLKTQNISRRLVSFIKRNGGFLVNGHRAKNHDILKLNDILTLEYHEKSNDEILPNFDEIEVVYEDEYFLICNKPSNLPTHPSKKHFTDTLANRIKGHFINKDEETNIHIITRLDAETSGLVLCAKSGYYHYLMSKEMNQLKRLYLARTQGLIKPMEGLIDKPILRLNPPSILRVISVDGKNAKTYYRVVRYGKDYTDVSLQLLTGRTHQIRVHLQSINHPIIGDRLYGDGEGIMHLHCYLLQFIHPFTKEEIKIVNYPNWEREVYDA